MQCLEQSSSSSSVTMSERTRFLAGPSSAWADIAWARGVQPRIAATKLTNADTTVHDIQPPSSMIGQKIHFEVDDRACLVSLDSVLGSGGQGTTFRYVSLIVLRPLTYLLRFSLHSV